jgi:hypothetical protein
MANFRSQIAEIVSAAVEIDRRQARELILAGLRRL